MVTTGYKVLTCYLPKGIITNQNVISDEKDFHDQPINSDIKRYKEMTKLVTRQGENYIKECQLDYEYIKNHHKLIAVDLSRQKELDAYPKVI